MEAERGTLKKKIFFTEAAFQSRFSKDVALKDCRLFLSKQAPPHAFSEAATQRCSAKKF